MKSTSIQLDAFDNLAQLKGLKFVHINVCSLFKKIDLFRESVLYDQTIDVCGISETWLKPHHDEKYFSMPGYQSVRLDRDRIGPNGSYVHGGGLLLLVNDSINIESVYYRVCTYDLELLAVTLKPEDQRHFHVLLLYRPHSGNCNSALDKLSDILYRLCSNSNARRTITVLGDFNINAYKSKPTLDYKALSALCNEHNLNQLIDVPTRYKFPNYSIIDLILSDSGIVSHHGTINCNLSDHLPIFLVIKKAKVHYIKTVFQGRSYLNYCKEDFQRDLKSINWGRFYSTTDVNEAWDIFYKHLLITSNYHAPVKRFSIKRDRPPWYNDDISELCVNHDYLFKV